MQQLDTQLTYHIRKHGLTIKQAKQTTRKAFHPELYQDAIPQPKPNIQTIIIRKPENVKSTYVYHGIENELGGYSGTNDAGISFKTAIQLNRAKIPVNTEYQISINGKIVFHGIRSNSINYQDDNPINQPIETKPQTVADGKPSITHNAKLNGIEVKFGSKPDDSVLNTLRNLGFRWSYKSMLWYNRYSDDLMSKVQAQIC